MVRFYFFCFYFYKFLPTFTNRILTVLRYIPSGDIIKTKPAFADLWSVAGSIPSGSADLRSGISVKVADFIPTGDETKPLASF
jgi:hypothetical protein